MKTRIGKIAIVSLCLAGLAACSSRQETPPDLKDTQSSKSAANSNGLSEGRSNNGSQSTADAATTAPGSATGTASSTTTGDASSAAASSSMPSAGGASSTMSAADAVATDAGAAGDDTPLDPNSPIVRVYQVDGTDSIDIFVDGRHMKRNLSLDDASCNVVFVVGSSTGAIQQQKDFALGDILVTTTPVDKVFRTFLGAGANALSYSFAATQRIIGALTGQRKLMSRKSTILRRPAGVSIREQAALKPPGAPIRIPAKSLTAPAKINATSATTSGATRVPALTDPARKPTRAGAIAPAATLKPGVKVRPR
jgi:hypothetical protein